MLGPHGQTDWTGSNWGRMFYLIGNSSNAQFTLKERKLKQHLLKDKAFTQHIWHSSAKNCSVYTLLTHYLFNIYILQCRLIGTYFFNYIVAILNLICDSNMSFLTFRNLFGFCVIIASLCFLLKFEKKLNVCVYVLVRCVCVVCFCVHVVCAYVFPWYV